LRLCQRLARKRRDNGTPSGLDISGELLEQLAQIRNDGNILPPPSMTVEKRILNGAPMAVVTVKPSDTPPVRYKGRIWVRTGPTRSIASAQDERILNERRRHGDLPFDAQPVPSSSLADLNIRMFEEEFLPQSIAADVLAANERTVEQRLAAAKMISSVDDLSPTVLGHLVLGIRPRDFLPGAYIQFLRIAGDDLSDPISDEAVLDGTLAEIIKKTEDKLAAHNSLTVDFTSNRTELRAATYPTITLEQLVRNALMHRTYEATNAPVRITWYKSHLDIFSPGGPFGIVTELNFGRPGYTDYRNPNIAEAMKVLGFVQRFGAGLQTARRELEKNGNPPMNFEISQAAISIRLEPRP
jgi:ATP-dependent DNA helicase RecG